VGDKTAGLEAFQKCVATGEKTFLEYDLARTELELLKQ